MGCGVVLGGDGLFDSGAQRFDDSTFLDVCKSQSDGSLATLAVRI